jgi:hypothetical protein
MIENRNTHSSPKCSGQYLDIRVQLPFSDVESKKDGEYNEREEEGNKHKTPLVRACEVPCLSYKIGGNK